MFPLCCCIIWVALHLAPKFNCAKQLHDVLWVVYANRYISVMYPFLLPTALHLPVSEETCLSGPLMAMPLIHSGLSSWSPSSALWAEWQDRGTPGHSHLLRWSRTCSFVMETIALLQYRSCVLYWSSSARIRKKGIVSAPPHIVLQPLLLELTAPRWEERIKHHI